MTCSRAAKTLPTIADFEKYREAFNLYGSERFDYGTSDCVLFVAKVIKHVHGVDHSSAFRYSGRPSALRMIATFGGFSGLIDYVLGEPKQEAEDGDVVLCRVDDVGEFLGIYLQGRVIAKTQTGAIAIRPDCVERIWNATGNRASC